MKKFLFILILLLAAAAAIFYFMNNQTYRLIKVKSFEGTVTVERKEKMEAFEGLQLISEDKVEVGKASFLELLADSDKHIIAEENTAFHLLSSGDEKSGNITVKMLKGKGLFTIDNKLPSGSDFIVKTPNVALSVRGTSYQVNYSPDTEESHIEVFDGVVHVQWASGQKLLGQGEEIIVTGNGDNVEVSVTSEGDAMNPSDEDDSGTDNAENPEVVQILNFPYTDSSAFNLRHFNTGRYSDIHVKLLEGWTAERVTSEMGTPDELTRNGIRIRYMILTKGEADFEKAGSKLLVKVKNAGMLENYDGTKIECIEYDFTGKRSGVGTVYQYYKKISRDTYLSMMVYDLEEGNCLTGTDIYTYLPLTNDCYYKYGD